MCPVWEKNIFQRALELQNFIARLDKPHLQDTNTLYSALTPPPLRDISAKGYCTGSICRCGVGKGPGGIHRHRSFEMIPLRI